MNNTLSGWPVDWQDSSAVGKAMHQLAVQLFPLNRSLTGDGVRQSLAMLQAYLPELQVHEIPSGTRCFDWSIPDEWNVQEAYIEGPNGERVVDFRWHNLHLVGYSEPVDCVLSLADLQAHLYSMPHLPEAIPYVTSYYRRRWGFCLTHRQREQLVDGDYHVVIKATLAPGSLTYGDILLPGESEQEVLLSSYLCHPSMANNELSGPLVGVFLLAWLSSLPRRRYSYRLMLVPETLGAITYLSMHLEHLKRVTAAGFNLSCVGDERAYSYLPSRQGDTLADRVALHVLTHRDPSFKRYGFLDRGSNERQLCAPGVDLPVASIMRSKYGTFPEYHTSLDDLTLVTPAGLAGSFSLMQEAVGCLEQDDTYAVTVLCEPQMGKYDLYPDLSTRYSGWQVRDMMNLLAYSDGSLSLLEIADTIGIPFAKARALADSLLTAGLLRPC